MTHCTFKKALFCNGHLTVITLVKSMQTPPPPSHTTHTYVGGLHCQQSDWLPSYLPAVSIKMVAFCIGSLLVQSVVNTQNPGPCTTQLMCIATVPCGQDQLDFTDLTLLCFKEKCSGEPFQAQLSYSEGYQLHPKSLSPPPQQQGYRNEPPVLTIVRAAGIDPWMLRMTQHMSIEYHTVHKYCFQNKNPEYKNFTQCLLTGQLFIIQLFFHSVQLQGWTPRCSQQGNKLNGWLSHPPQKAGK